MEWFFRCLAAGLVEQYIVAGKITCNNILLDQIRFMELILLEDQTWMVFGVIFVLQ